MCGPCRGYKQRPGTVQEPRGKGASAVGNRYRATASEDFMCAIVTMIFGMCNSVRL
jgi:hypothetical protein